MEAYINDDADDCEIPTERDDHSTAGAANVDLELQQMPSLLSKLSVGSVEQQKAPLRLLLISLLNVLSIRTEDKRMAIAYPVMKANRRTFETQRRHEIK